MKQNSAKVGTKSASIQVRNLQHAIRVNVSALERFAQRALRVITREARRGNYGAEMSDGIQVLLISDRRMASLHRRFLNRSGPTDVITFQHGEIFISIPTARKQAREFGTSILHEIQLYIVHGLLHLHGFDDRTERQTRQMRAAEARILRCAMV